MSNAVNRARLAMKSVSTASSVIVFEDIKAGCYAMKRALRQTQRTRSLWEKKISKNNNTNFRSRTSSKNTENSSQGAKNKRY